LSDVLKICKNQTSAQTMDKAIQEIRAEIAQQCQKRKRLADVDLIVLDNSIRESTVGQLRGHTLENKWKIYDEVQRAGFQYKVVAAFSHMTRVDDKFIKQLIAEGENCEDLFAFTEAFESVDDQETLPVGLRKMKSLGLINPIIEIDTLRFRTQMNIDQWCKLLKKRIEWVKEHLTKDGHDPKIFVNYRDFSDAMYHNVEPYLKLTTFLGSLPENLRPFGLMFEEPRGTYMPIEVGKWCKAVRTMMDLAGWEEGHLFAHVHEKWGLAVAAQLECIISGANGVWASVCEEGAALGHACSTLTILNLLRNGNKKVRERYDCQYLRNAAIEVSKITTGRPPHEKKPVYGERALDISFDFGGIAGGRPSSMDAGDDFDIADFFEEEAPIRISTLSSEGMIVERLVQLFGENNDFNEDIAREMKAKMIEELEGNTKREYMSAPGIATLFDRSGGQMTIEMANVIAKSEDNSAHATAMIEEIRDMWDEWDLQEDDEHRNDDKLKYDSFYNGFMAPFFGCQTCDDTLKGFGALDMDHNGEIDWNEFLVYLKWACNEFPDITEVDELLSVTFRKGLIPAMKDVVLGRQASRRQTRAVKGKGKGRNRPNRRGNAEKFGMTLTIPE